MKEISAIKSENKFNTISMFTKIRIRIIVIVCYDTLRLMILYKHRSRSDPPRVSSPSVAYTCMQFNDIQLCFVQSDELQCSAAPLYSSTDHAMRCDALQ